MFYDTNSLPSQPEITNTFLPLNMPVTGKSVVQDLPLVPIIPYSKPKIQTDSFKSRIEFLKKHIGSVLKVKLNDSSVYTGTLVETGDDFFNIASLKNSSVMMFDINSIKYIKVYPDSP